MPSGAASPLLALSVGQPSTWGTGTRYLVPFVAPSSAHPVGPHGGEEGQVVAVGLRQEHRLPRVQGEAGAGVPLLRKSRATERVEGAPTWASASDGLTPQTLPVGPRALCPDLGLGVCVNFLLLLL